MSASDFSPSKKLLLHVTGSVAAFKAAALASAAMKAGFEVRVVLTDGALEFVGAATFEGITGNPVHQSTFEPGQRMAHIDLERWADAILVYPATANTISLLANGLGTNLTSTLFLAHEFKKPWIVAPAMNQAMWKHPAIRENLARLQRWGVEIFEPASGRLACGEVGEGRLLEPEDALLALEKHFEVSRMRQERSLPRVLVTAGGTSEPIDDVRHLANFSTGRTGYTIAKSLQDHGHAVTLLQSELSGATRGIDSLILYSTTKDFATKLEQELSRTSYDWVIHAAAVADFHVESITDSAGKSQDGVGKLRSEEPLMLRLVPNPKVIRSLRDWSRNRNLKIISFKLTIDDSTDPKFETYDSEWIIQNHLKDVGENQHRGAVYARTPSGTYERRQEFRTKPELVDTVLSLLEPTGGHA